MGNGATDDDFIEVVTWALDRILNDEFVIVRSADGGVESLKLDKRLKPVDEVVDLDVVEATLTSPPKGEINNLTIFERTADTDGH